MFIEFEEAEVRELISLLEDTLTALRAEARRTEDHDFKLWLRQRQQMLERMLERCLTTPLPEK